MVRLAGVLLVTGWAAAPVVAQVRSPRYELGAVALAIVETPTVIGVGLHAAVRPGGNARIALNVVPAGSDGRAVARGELLVHFILSPQRQKGVSPYALGGVAGVTGAGTAGYMVVGLGVESSPGGRRGWALEGGVGGGVRLTAGWRWRW
jgi:hypothetical protein